MCHLPATDVSHLPATDVSHLPATDVSHLPVTDVSHLPVTDVCHLQVELASKTKRVVIVIKETKEDILKLLCESCDFQDTTKASLRNHSLRKKILVS
ncbi:hypothetical protein EB796_009392 [Bugula neritina]|uniref:Uncharacterized protein n=1 Tax=Bugula neritina TaxID=10212 RepID=A0A7J7K2V1_BUGNE|nr:hypothetical protein EB796_009392 [Bugula neritina]